MDDHNSLQDNECYKNLNKHMKFSKCNIVITRDNFKKGRTVCKVCYNNHVLAYYKNTFCPNSSPKSDVSTQTEFLNKQDISRKQVSSRIQDSSNKQVGSNKQGKSSKQDSSIILENVDPDFPMETFSELYNSKYASNEKPQPIRESAKATLAELLRVLKKIVKFITLIKKVCRKTEKIS